MTAERNNVTNPRAEITSKIAPVSFKPVEKPQAVSAYFGCNTFKEETMRSMVSEATFKAFKRWQDEGKVISKEQANEIAEALKNWAISCGATCYTHWFQPMTGQTAEKHDSFVTLTGPGNAIERFTGNKLIQGEPDASSFPSGGLRATFEARGYTAWDPSSPAFIVEVDLGKTLCIPSIFVSYNGDSLDKKLPLLRSDAALSAAAVELLRLFGNTEASRIFSTCGPEQEYFLIDDGYYRLRSDLQLTGRTLVGALSPKGQQLEDQYFGSIKERVLNFMNEMAEEAYKLGIPVTTRHNEVAPHQFEVAPFFERSNIAADHNQLLMDLMKKTAMRHGLACLLHEKPFAGINGSGKHLNWSLSDDYGNNLLNPGETPEENLVFLTVLVAIIQAVYRHADLLRASIASAGNEHRLGANEAPPAIMSVFLGEQLTRLLNNIRSGEMTKVSRADIVSLGVSHLPNLTKDTTDRNRTSPFAFTGNKFEFRALGSSMNISTAIAVVNAVVADSFNDMTRRIREATACSGTDFTKAVFGVLSQVVKESSPVLFEGDNYSEAWVREAAKRGLPNVASTCEALAALIKPENIALFERQKVFSKSEIVARYHIWVDIYDKMIDIEARTLAEIASTQVLPAAYAYQTRVGDSLETLERLCKVTNKAAVDDRRSFFEQLTNDILYVHRNIAELEKMIDKALELDEEKRADYYFETLKPQMAHIRRHIDELERVMPDELWQLPKYREMLFIA
ncbi:MAG: glutamine synthetase III [Deltaproteobacteria bacterium]|nr:glutamine synthetase III [Deltaproteobacteria bacterium]